MVEVIIPSAHWRTLNTGVPADVPALAAGSPVSPGRDAIHYIVKINCPNKPVGPPLDIFTALEEGIKRQRDANIMAAIHEIARN